MPYRFPYLRCYSYNGYLYYTYDMPAVTKGAPGLQCVNPNPKTPIVFLHGVGLGLFPYVPFLSRLAATGHPVLAVEFL